MHTVAMEWNWSALGAALRARRDVLRMTRPELAEKTGLHTGTIKNYESGQNSYDKIPKGIMVVAAEIGWTAGSVQSVLEGGAPTLRQHAIVRYATTDDGSPRVLRVSDLQGAARNGIFSSIPGATAAEIMAAEQRIVAILRENGLLPPEGDGDDVVQISAEP